MIRSMIRDLIRDSVRDPIPDQVRYPIRDPIPSAPVVLDHFRSFLVFVTTPALCILSKQQNHKWSENIVQIKHSCEIITSNVGPSSTTRHTVLIGHNSSVFDTPTLLRCAGLDFKQMLSSMNFSFVYSLHLLKTLTKNRHTSLNLGGKARKSNLPSVFKTLFDEYFQAHYALEGVRALRRVLFEFPLKLTDEDIWQRAHKAKPDSKTCRKRPFVTGSSPFILKRWKRSISGSFETGTSRS
ncbi:hypothetical protein pdam_00023861 [Pocillopora damicornis]|uniref:Exonuclease domain-containing protein n=1 Tax=Pocillopora damicornis TaxID=46731 RepID=A0A3M6THH9_POCDA|nr:hypothetical protein pdam_00023861 [Pocillopora damicornis]